MPLAELTKAELHALADQLLLDDQLAVETCILFIEGNSRGVWHGRARSMMSRRLKHCTLSRVQRARLVQVTLRRLTDGEFTEQFRDQLRLALRLDRPSVRMAATECLNSDKAHVRRYALWLMERTGE